MANYYVTLPLVGSLRVSFEGPNGLTEDEAIEMAQNVPRSLWVTAYTIFEGWVDPQGFVLGDGGERLHPHPKIISTAKGGKIMIDGDLY